MSLHHQYRVWAPRPAHVALQVNGDQLAMRRDDRGWWTADRTKRDGDRYGYLPLRDLIEKADLTLREVLQHRLQPADPEAQPDRCGQGQQGHN